MEEIKGIQRRYVELGERVDDPYFQRAAGVAAGVPPLLRGDFDAAADIGSGVQAVDLFRGHALEDIQPARVCQGVVVVFAVTDVGVLQLAVSFFPEDLTLEIGPRPAGEMEREIL